MRASSVVGNIGFLPREFGEGLPQSPSSRQRQGAGEARSHVQRAASSLPTDGVTGGGITETESNTEEENVATRAFAIRAWVCAPTTENYSSVSWRGGLDLGN